MKPLLKFIFFLLASSSLAQQCDNNIVESATFTTTGTSTAALLTSNLVWQRCNLGEQWNGQTCSGKAGSFTFIQALSMAKQFAKANGGHWRLPTTEELQMLISDKCRLPAINLGVFPTTKNAPYLTSERFSFYAHVVSFDHGYTFSTQMEHAQFVRLVRDD